MSLLTSMGLLSPCRAHFHCPLMYTIATFSVCLPPILCSGHQGPRKKSHRTPIQLHCITEASIEENTDISRFCAVVWGNPIPAEDMDPKKMSKGWDLLQLPLKTLLGTTFPTPLRLTKVSNNTSLGAQPGLSWLTPSKSWITQEYSHPLWVPSLGDSVHPWNQCVTRADS